MSEWTQGDVIVSGIRLHYHRTGGNKPPLVLAHGITDNGLCWTPTARALEGGYNIVMYDARAHGRSEVPRTPPRWQELADDLAALVEALELSAPCAMGHSMSAVTVATAAAQHRGLIRRAILVDPPWRRYQRTKAEGEAMRQERRKELLARQQCTRDDLIALCRQQSPTWPEAELGPWADAKLQVEASAVELYGREPSDWRATAQEFSARRYWSRRTLSEARSSRPSRPKRPGGCFRGVRSCASQGPDTASSARTPGPFLRRCVPFWLRSEIGSVHSSDDLRGPWTIRRVVSARPELGSPRA